MVVLVCVGAMCIGVGYPGVVTRPYVCEQTGVACYPSPGNKSCSYVLHTNVLCCFACVCVTHSHPRVNVGVLVLCASAPCNMWVVGSVHRLFHSWVTCAAFRGVHSYMLHVGHP